MASKLVFKVSEYEKDPRWSAVDDYTFTNLHPSTRPNHSVLTYALENSLKKGLPDIATYAVFSKYLALQCRLSGATHALEVGTLGGYTSIWLATENPNLRVTTLEVNPMHAEVARENIEKAGVSDRVEVRVGKALEILPELYEEVKRGEKDKIGFVYIDADKVNNVAYFDWAVKMCKPRACLFVDNVVRRGKLAIEDNKEGQNVGSRALVETVGKDKRVDGVVMQTVGEKDYDGFLMAVVKDETE